MENHPIRILRLKEIILMKRVRKKLNAAFAQRSRREIAEDERKLWPALPVAALFLVWSLEPLKPFLSPGLMAGAGVFASAGIVGYYAARNLQSGRWARLVAGSLLLSAAVMLIFALDDAVAISNANAKRCRLLETALLSDRAGGPDAADKFQALHCRPTGV